MTISTYIEPLSNIETLIINLFINEFNIESNYAKNLYDDHCKAFFDKLKDNIYIVAENNYVDKVYRDSYYNYYSSKRKDYLRETIRLSFFENIVDINDFWQQEKYENIQNSYRGFMVLRPTTPKVIGRNVISPKALKSTSFSVCLAKFDTTVNGVKFSVSGFPHSSQDAETITCAETSLWALMEYFSNKYSEYKPTLPSNIIKTLNSLSPERQMPSKGLNIIQLSFALKEFGFGTRIYDIQQFGVDFNNILSCYIESGIPLLVSMDNRSAGGNIGHALLCIGHEKIEDEDIDNLQAMAIGNPYMSHSANTRNITIFDYNNIEKKFIFIDDNYSPYQIATLQQPANHYPIDWHNCTIKSFVAPLYPKIYLEAYEARGYILAFLLNGIKPISNNNQITLRLYLTSSRSFKDVMARSTDLDANLKTILIESKMAKFIWVAELSNKDLLKENKANGIIVLDATEANIYDNKPLILAAYEGEIIINNETNNTLEKLSLDLQEYTMYHNNLKSF